MKLKEFVSSVGELNMSSIIAGGSIAELANMTKRLLEGTAGLANDMRLFGLETGLSEQRMNSWTQAAKTVGLNGDIIKQSLTGIVELQRQMSMGQMSSGWQSALAIMANVARIRIDPRENPFTQILKVQEAIASGKLSQLQQLTVLQGFGMPIQMLDMMKESKEFWKTIDSRPPMVSKEDEAAMKEMASQWSKLVMDIERAGINFAVTIAPAVTEMVKAIDKAANSPIIKWLGQQMGDFGERMNIYGTMWKALGANMEAALIPTQHRNAVAELNQPNYGAQSNSFVFHIQGDNPQTIAKHVHASLKDWLSETHYQAARNHR